VLHRSRAIGPLILGSLVAATFAGIELSRYGTIPAAFGAYLVFGTTQAAFISWNRYKLRHARRRIAALRDRRSRVS
jgi:hypothetical protein